MRLTKSLQEKLEEIFKSLEYRVRYEKGTFRSGYCLLEDQRVVVVNKFLPTESKVSTLLDILRDIEVDEKKLNPAQQKLVVKLKQTELQF